jgi:probable aminopeptidase NPEPL1
VSSKATRPDDVHLLYSGKSVEVNNPDAEGRLGLALTLLRTFFIQPTFLLTVVLADGLAYAAKRYAPGLLVDMATLTGWLIEGLDSTTRCTPPFFPGAQGTATGNKHAAIYASSEKVLPSFHFSL